jgi:hypothetical protein
MPQTYKVLGQVAATAATTHNVYTVPAATQAVVSSIIVTNRNSAANVTYRLAVQPAGVALANQHYIAYDSTVTALDSVALSLGLSLGNTDVLSVYAGNSNVSFSVFGVEIT